MPLVAYKHVLKEYANAFEAGESIQIGTLAHYRAMEGARADPLEGVAEYNIGMMQPYDFLDPSLTEIRRDLGLQNLPPNAIYAHNTIRRIQPPTYIFCSSAEPDFSLVSKGYEIFRIGDLERLAWLVRIKGNRALGRAICGPVHYEARSIDPIRERRMLKEGAFQKTDSLGWENEIRIAWKTRWEFGPTALIQAPLAHELIERIT